MRNKRMIGNALQPIYELFYVGDATLHTPHNETSQMRAYILLLG